VEHVSQLTRLEVLDLSSCSGLTASGLTDIFRGLSQLRQIDLCHCTNVADATLNMIARGNSMFQIYNFKFRKCPLSPHQPRSFIQPHLSRFESDCPKLTSLNLAHCRQVTDRGMTRIAESCPLLEDLEIMNCKELTKDSLLALSQGCRRLKRHRMTFCGCVNIGMLTRRQWLMYTLTDDAMEEEAPEHPSPVDRPLKRFFV
jgi:F-box/leucine-rich repeat protein 2/20